MCGASRARDDYLQSAICGLPSKIGGGVRRAMCGKNMMLIGDAKLVERFDTVPHRIPIGRAAHKDGDK
jgi:hypothetical protein